MIGVLHVIRNNPHEGAGLIGDIARSLGLGMRVTDAFDGGRLPRPGAVGEAVVILGGQQAVYELDAHPYLAGEIELAGHCVARGIPLLGICLGAQLIASALGGDVRRGGVREIGWAPVRFAAGAGGLPGGRGLVGEPEVFHFHGDRIEALDGAEVIASTDATPCQAFHCGGRVLGFQYHPEVDGALAAAMIRENADYVREAGVSPEEALSGNSSRAAASMALHEPVLRGWLLS